MAASTLLVAERRHKPPMAEGSNEFGFDWHLNQHWHFSCGLGLECDAVWDGPRQLVTRAAKVASEVAGEPIML